MRSSLKTIRGLIAIAAAATIAAGAVAAFQHPYGINAWDYPNQGVDLLKEAHITRYRNFTSWGDAEPRDLAPDATGGYNWWHNTLALAACVRTGAKISLSVWGSPAWAQSQSGVRLSYSPAKYAEFITAMLRHADAIAPDAVESVDLGNEDLIWETPLERDPSWYYADILRAGYAAVKAHNPNILVIPACVWQDAAHLLDEMYQLGLKECFDRISIHPYSTDPRAPVENGRVSHYPTVMRYIKYIADQNGDAFKPVWNTEYAYKVDVDEVTKTDRLWYTLEQSRRLGFIEKAFMYPGITGYHNDSYDIGGLIYAMGPHPWEPAVPCVPTTAYYMYQSYSGSHPLWDSASPEPADALPPASADAFIPNAGFENGAAGWTGATVDLTSSRSGAASGRAAGTGAITSAQKITLEKGRLYEVAFWTKISAADPKSFRLECPIIPEGIPGWHWPPMYDGLVDTRRYPGGWRRVRYMLFTSSAPTFTGKVTLRFNGAGSGAGTAVFWIDDISIRRLDLTVPAPVANLPPVPPTDLRCNGQANPDSVTGIPVLAWRFRDPDPYDSQSAYRIIVSTNPSDAAAGVGSTWDSGWRESLRSSAAYAGPAIAPGYAYFWRVMTQDGFCATSSWSAVAHFSATRNHPPASPDDLRCDGATDPTGMSSPHPVLSWTHHDIDPWDAIPSGFHLFIATAPMDAAAGNGTVWDSGLVHSSQTAVAYGGPALVPGATYYWTVRSRDTIGALSPLSPVGVFSMAQNISNTPPDTPHSLTCDGVMFPGPVASTAAPLLGWIFSDPDSDDRQSAYRVQVFPDETETAPLWDTGKVASTATYVRYGGPALAPGTTVYWRVMVWDRWDAASGFSAAASFAIRRPAVNTPPNAPTQLRCGGDVNPVNVSVPWPLLSWTFSDPEPDDTQSACEVRVASSPAALGAGGPLLWNSGVVISSASFLVYGGEALAGGTTCWWQVRVRDSRGAESPWSATALFVTASTHTVAPPPGVNSPPSVSIVEPAPGATAWSTSSVRVSAVASDPDGVIVSVEMFINGVSTAVFTNTAGGASLSVSVELTGLVHGTNTVRIAATDNDGAYSWAETPVFCTGAAAPTEPDRAPDTPLPAVPPVFFTPEALVPGTVRVIGGTNGWLQPSRGDRALFLAVPVEHGEITVAVYTLSGRPVWKGVVRAQRGGAGIIAWDCVNQDGEAIGSGVYTLVVRGAGIAASRRIAVVR
jgi:hypothetical protein